MANIRLSNDPVSIKSHHADEGKAETASALRHACDGGKGSRVPCRLVLNP